jgi:hypothetical protein
LKYLYKSLLFAEQAIYILHPEDIGYLRSGFEYFPEGFAHKLVPTLLELVPVTIYISFNEILEDALTLIMGAYISNI